MDRSASSSVNWEITQDVKTLSSILQFGVLPLRQMSQMQESFNRRLFFQVLKEGKIFSEVKDSL